MILLCAQFVYDAWYATLTPDREFPREIRRILNTAFGELAERGRRVDLRKMLLGCGRPRALCLIGGTPGGASLPDHFAVDLQ